MSTYVLIVYDVSNIVTVHFTDQRGGFPFTQRIIGETRALQGMKREREGDRNFITLNYLMMKSNALPSTFFFPSALDGHALI